MKFALVAAILFGCAGPAMARSPIDGSWVADLKTEDATETVDIYRVANGNYACDSCNPPRAYPADGQSHAIAGDPETTSEPVTVIGERTIVTRIHGPTLTRKTTMTVAVDDKTATYVSIDHRSDLPGALRTEYLARRIAPAPAGANRVSGSWRGVHYVSVPAPLRTITLRVDGDKFTYSLPTGVHYTAIYGGPFVPIQSRHGGTEMAAVEKINDRTIVESRKVEGTLVVKRTYTLAANGKSLEITTLNVATGTTYRATFRRE